jgi:putative membrane protein
MPQRSRILFTLTALLTATLLSAAPAGAQVSDQDTQFLIAAHQSNLAEIAAGQAAQQQATTDTVRRLGQMFIEMHTQLDQQVTAVAGELGVQLPGTPSEQQQAELAAVAANTGQAFDTAWIAQQLGSHQRSLANGSRELQAGSDERVIALARASAPVIEQHLAELRQAAEQYGVPTAVPGGTGGQAAAGTSRPVGTALAALGVLLVATSVLGLTRGRRRA